MKTETERIKVSIETARLLRRRAEGEGIDVDVCLRKLVETDVVPREGKMSEADIEQIPDALPAGTRPCIAAV